MHTLTLYVGARYMTVIACAVVADISKRVPMFEH